MKKLPFNNRQSLQELVPIAIGMYGSLSQKAFLPAAASAKDGGGS